ncbi:hypothetical protein CPB84DRAFT_1750943 [Gymnopilus junonius]|uniref:Uncharacterized protein n=1 Tax=Gymnopilus junonius TaxID=109634 RepID=A0A9P5THR3_GYMJU|nr:hypothetical protein CPB84DRAFT_1750943 [Gymnopilus junonius]
MTSIPISDSQFPSKILTRIFEEVHATQFASYTVPLFWAERNLFIDHCTTFSDAVLEALAVKVQNQHQGAGTEPDSDGFSHFALCDFLTDLNLNFTDLHPPYSVATVKKLVEARGRGVDYSNEHWLDSDHKGSPLGNLRVTGETPGLSEQDEEWFRSRLMGI